MKGRKCKPYAFKLMKAFEKVMQKNYDRFNSLFIRWCNNYTRKKAKQKCLTAQAKELFHSKNCLRLQKTVCTPFYVPVCIELVQQNFCHLLGEEKNNFLVNTMKCRRINDEEHMRLL